MPDPLTTSSFTRPPAAALLHYSIVLTGFGTVFLGPLLPTLTASLHSNDRGGGTLLAAQFIGAFFGGWTTRTPLGGSMLRGYVAAILGFAALGWCCNHLSTLHWFLPALLLLGFGIGQLLTSTNLLASQRWTVRRGAALTLLNFSWSVGALTAPLLLLRLLQICKTGTLLYGMAALLIAGVAAAWFTGTLQSGRSSQSTTGSGSAGNGMPFRRFLFFALLLMIYGGVETSMGGWLTTYDNRYGIGLYHQMALSTTLFWACLTFTRAFATAALLRVRESLLLRAGLALAVFAIAGLLSAHGFWAVSLSAGLLGAALAPWFPLVLSQMIAEAATASQVGKIVAVSGLGAAAIPWLVGQMSAATGSLRVGLTLPILGVLVLLLCSFVRPETRTFR